MYGQGMILGGGCRRWRGESLAIAVSERIYCHSMAKAVALGRRGGKKGGKARWKGVSPEERSKVLSRAARARWKKRKKQEG